MIDFFLVGGEIVDLALIHELVGDQEGYGVDAFILDFGLLAQTALQKCPDDASDVWNQLGIREQDVVLQSPESRMLIFCVFRSCKIKQNIDVSLIIVN